MIASSPNSLTSFDAVAQQYNQELNRGISLSGESADYFVEGRVRWLSSTMARYGASTESILDFGCGVGNAAPMLLQELKGKSLVGLDPSAGSIEQARKRWQQSSMSWTTDGADVAAGSIDLVHTSGVFHHIPVDMRDSELARIHQWLRPGGWFALFENNPWNPGTRWVMSRIPFDHDAITLTPFESRSRLKNAGFRVIDTRFLFFFPHVLRTLRGIEPSLSRFPLGAQYVVLGQKPI